MCIARQTGDVAMWIVVARARVACDLSLLLVACGRTLVCLLCLGASGGCCNAAMSNVNVQSAQCAMCRTAICDMRDECYIVVVAPQSQSAPRRKGGKGVAVPVRAEDRGGGAPAARRRRRRGRGASLGGRGAGGAGGRACR
jgi:hypothetical protein